MSTPVLDDRTVRTEGPRRRTTWLLPAAAAAVVALLAVGTAWWAGGTGGEPTQAIASQPTAGGDQVILDAPGWVVTAAYASKFGGEMTYENGAGQLEIDWYPADSYDSYVEDRRHINEPPTDGAPITVLGAGALTWAYSATDHTAIREVEDGQWLEFRGSGMAEPDYRALLGELRLVDQAAFEASLPDDFVTTDERAAAINDILNGIATVADPLLPNGVARSSITSDQNDSYQLGAEVAGAVACDWLNEFADAQRSGDEARAQRAADVLATSHDWPVLHQMNDRGDYPEVLWDYADQVAAGRVPDGYRQGLGCQG